MSKTSWAGRVIDAEDNAFSVDRPVHVAQAFLLRNNIAHAIDESTQTRIGWSEKADTASGGQILYVMGGGPVLYPEEFTLTWLADRKPANLYLAVTLRGSDAAGGEDLSYRVSIVPAFTPVGQGSSLAIFEEIGTVASDTDKSITQIIDCSQFIGQLSSAWAPVGLVDDGDLYREVIVSMLRLEVAMSFPTWDSEDAYYIRLLFLSEHA